MVVALMSPIACMAFIAKRIEIARIDENSKRMPNGAGLTRENMPASPTAERSIMPKGMEKTYPTAMPSRIEASFTSPFAKWFRLVTHTRVKMATSQFCQLPKSGFPLPPAMYVIAVGYSDSPIVKTTVPVIRGGNRCWMRFANMPMTMATREPTSCAPNISAMENVVAMLCIVARYAKLTPMITGSLAPHIRVTPNSCSSVESAAHTRDDCIRRIRWALSSPATDEMIIAGVTQPTIIATRCCKASGSEHARGGSLPSMSNSSLLSSISRIVSWKTVMSNAF